MLRTSSDRTIICNKKSGGKSFQTFKCRQRTTSLRETCNYGEKMQNPMKLSATSFRRRSSKEKKNPAFHPQMAEKQDCSNRCADIVQKIEK